MVNILFCAVLLNQINIFRVRLQEFTNSDADPTKTYINMQKETSFKNQILQNFKNLKQTLTFSML